MSDLYKMKNAGASPLTVGKAKAFMKVSSNTDDALIGSLITAATEFGENYTGREFRSNVWTMHTDDFRDRITLNRNPIASVTSVKHLVSDVLTTVSGSLYYLKSLVQCSEILLLPDNEWPTNTDDREQAIQIEFVTESYHRENEILDAIKRHASFMYSNRGDCSCDQSSSKESGAAMIYDQFRISRV